MKNSILKRTSMLPVLCVVLSALCVAGLPMPGIQSSARAADISISAADTQKINNKCDSVLGKKASKLDVQACVSGYLLALEKAGTGDCDKPPYKGHASAIDACKNTGYNLGKKNAAGVTVKKGSKPPAPQAAQGGNCDSDHCDLVALYVNPLINVLSVIVGLAVAASLVLGGIQYSAAGGDAQKVSAAKARITNTLAALIAFAFMYAFLNFLIPGGIF